MTFNDKLTLLSKMFKEIDWSKGGGELGFKVFRGPLAGDAVVAGLCGGEVKKEGLKELSLNEVILSSMGVRRIVGACPNLERLSLTEGAVGDCEAVYLGRLKRLRYLDITGGEVGGDRIVRLMRGLKGLRGIKYTYFYYGLGGRVEGRKDRRNVGIRRGEEVEEEVEMFGRKRRSSKNRVGLREEYLERFIAQVIKTD